MANKTATPTTPEADQAATGEELQPEAEKHYLELQASEETGVIEADFKFNHYVPGGRDAITETDIHHLFMPGFDPTPFHFSWYHYAKASECGQRFFTVCRKDIHGKLKWFRDQAWEPTLNQIVCGWDYKANRKELVLVVRSAKANKEEVRQMLAMSQDQNNPESGSQVSAAKDRLQEHRDNLPGSDKKKYVQFTGDGLKTTSSDRW